MYFVFKDIVYVGATKIVTNPIFKSDGYLTFALRLTFDRHNLEIDD